MESKRSQMGQSYNNVSDETQVEAVMQTQQNHNMATNSIFMFLGNNSTCNYVIRLYLRGEGGIACG